MIYIAGAPEDGTIGALTPEQLERTLASRMEGALHLHELTAHLELESFLAICAAAGTLGSPGQAGRAVLAAFLEALAHRCRAGGTHATAIALGPLAAAGGPPERAAAGVAERAAAGVAERATAGVTEHAAASGPPEGVTARAPRAGLGTLSAQEGLELFDAARVAADALVLAACLDRPALRAQARAGMLPATLCGLVRTLPRRAGEAGGSLARRLAAVPEGERERSGAGAGARRRWPPCWATPRRARSSRGARSRSSASTRCGGGAAQPAARRDRAAPAGDAGVRPPDAGGARRRTCWARSTGRGRESHGAPSAAVSDRRSRSRSSA